MHPRSLRLLELNKIIDLLKEKCATPMGVKLAEDLRPHTNRNRVLDLQSQTTEAVKLLVKEEPSLYGLSDISFAVGRAQKGGMLDPGQLYAVANFLAGSTTLKRFMDKHAVKDSWIYLSAQGLVDLPHLTTELNRTVDRDGNVLDTASSELRSLRRKLDIAHSRLRDRLDSMVKSSKTQKYLQDPLVTQRAGRYCLPVKAEYRAQVPGVVHDQSSSGATLFIEPMAAVQTSNEITQLERQEQTEVERVLRELSQEVGSHGEGIFMALEAVAELDFALARAKLALDMDATGPEIRGDRHLQLLNCRHPLLPTKEVVPTTITLGDEYSVLVITGPNTGGKTVTLKTVGLFCLMAQCGLWLPVSSGSCVPVYNNIFADIGDEQSIEQSLSTFSSHMTNIIQILEEANTNSLVLLDELGAGTDPAEGAALATALLNQLKQAKISVVATTHYSELKAYAGTEPGVQNASMEFDLETLRPTYRLMIGTPGKSNAFEIALRLGLGAQVVDRARGLLNTDTRRTEDLLTALEGQRLEAEANLARAQEEREQAEKLRRKYQQKWEDLEQRQENLLERAREKSNDLLRNSRYQAEQILADSHQANETVIADDLADKTREALKPVAVQREKRSGAGTPPKLEALKPGLQVKVLSLDKTGTVVSVSPPDEVVVQVGIMKVTLKATDLRLSSFQKKESPKPGRNVTKTAAADVSPEIDLRGKMVDEAGIEIDKFLDLAMLSGLNQVHIIHGKGTGALGKGVQEFLKTHPAVASFRYGKAGEGGSGVTVVTLKD